MYIVTSNITRGNNHWVTSLVNVVLKKNIYTEYDSTSLNES